MEFTHVPFDAAAAGLLTVAQARARLAVSEPLAFITFETGQPGIDVTYGKGWHEAELTEACAAWLTLPGGEVYQLTHQAAKQLGSTARANRGYQEFLPHELLSRAVTWALTEGLHKKNGDGIELKMLVAGTGRNPEDTGDVPLMVAQTRATVEPFSNLELLDTVLLAIRAKLGNEAADGAWVDPRFFHDLEHTSFRVVVPLAQQAVGEEDAWCYGIAVSNSIIGAKQLTIGGYLFQFSTLAGIADRDRFAGGFNRRGSTPAAAYRWAAEAAEDILGRVDEAFIALAELPAVVVDGEYASVMEQFFLLAPVSKDLQLRIVTDLEEHPAEELTLYDLAVTAAIAANLDGSGWRDVSTVHNLAGFILHQGGSMCDGSLEHGCRRLLPDDWEARQAS